MYKLISAHKYGFEIGLIECNTCWPTANSDPCHFFHC